MTPPAALRDGRTDSGATVWADATTGPAGTSPTAGRRTALVGRGGWAAAATDGTAGVLDASAARATAARAGLRCGWLRDAVV